MNRVAKHAARSLINLIGFLLLVVAGFTALFLIVGAVDGSLTAAQAIIGLAVVIGVGWLSYKIKV